MEFLGKIFPRFLSQIFEKFALPHCALVIGLANACYIMSVKPIAKWFFASCPS